MHGRSVLQRALLQDIDGLRGVVALSSPGALASGVTADVVDGPDRGNAARPRSVVFGRLTRPTCGHVIFRSQLLALVEGDLRTRRRWWGLPLNMESTSPCPTADRDVQEESPCRSAARRASQRQGVTLLRCYGGTVEATIGVLAPAVDSRVEEAAAPLR